MVIGSKFWPISKPSFATSSGLNYWLQAMEIISVLIIVQKKERLPETETYKTVQRIISEEETER